MERKYGPKPRTKDRDKTAKRYVTRKATFGVPTERPVSPRAGFVQKRTPNVPYRPKVDTVKGAYKPRGTNAPERPTATGYVKKGFTPSAPFKKSTSWSKSKTEKGKFTPYKPVYKSKVPNKPKTASASWGSVASWYDKHLNETDTYHEKVIQPNLMRLIDAEAGDNILDLACGQGFFTRAIAKTGAKVEGIDIAPELIQIAKAESPEIPYHVGSAENLDMFRDEVFSKALISLAIQNIEEVEGVLKEAARVLRSKGSLHIVMNHPAFRIPKQSAWGYDDQKKVQFRRVDQYLSNSRSTIDMHPGFADAPQTVSFHRPLQFYFKALAKAGFVVTRLEEWISHKASDSGPRAKAENNARKEIPLFLYLKVVKQ